MIPFVAFSSCRKLPVLANSYFEEHVMRILFLATFFVLLVTWLLAWAAFHIASGLIHLLLLAAVISLILHLVSGRRSA